MLIYQSYTIECDDHSFEFELSHETATFMLSRGFKGRIEGVVCPICNKVMALDSKHLFAVRSQAERDVADEALEELNEELRKDKHRTKKLHETQRMYQKCIEDKVKEKGALKLEKKHIHETPDARLSA